MKDRHAIDVEHCGVRLKDFLSDLSELLPHLERDASNACSLSDATIEAACCGAVARADGKSVRSLFQLAATLAAGAYQLARSGTKPGTTHITLREPVNATYKLSGRVDWSLVNAGDWLNSLCAGIIAGDESAIDALLQAPDAIFVRSPTRSLPTVYSLIEWMRAGIHYQRGESWKPPADSRNTSKHAWTRRIYHPAVHFMVALVENRDVATESLSIALQQHEAYWSSTSMLRLQAEGFVSLPLLAIASMLGYRPSGMVSRYFPIELVTPARNRRNSILQQPGD